MQTKLRRYRVTFEYGNVLPGQTIRAQEWVTAPTKMLALWAAREQRHGCMIRDPECVKETVGIVRARHTVEHSEAKALRKYECEADNG